MSKRHLEWGIGIGRDGWFIHVDQRTRTAVVVESVFSYLCWFTRHKFELLLMHNPLATWSMRSDTLARVPISRDVAAALSPDFVQEWEDWEDDHHIPA